MHTPRVNTNMNQSVTYIILMFTACLLGACSLQPEHPLPANIISAGALPPTDPALDHFIAWVPLKQAQTATVAEAMTHISLQSAREQTRSAICNGNPVMQGKVIERLGPVAAMTPTSMGGQPAWYYRISQQPGVRGCNSSHSTRFFQAMQIRLPEWINIQSAQPGNNRTAGLAPGNR